MGPFRALLLYLAAVFVGGALLAPWLYWTAEAAGLIGSHAAPPFHRFVNRSILICAIVGLWPLARAFRINSWRELGFSRTRDWPVQVGRGFVLGAGSLVLVAALALAGGVRNWRVYDNANAIWIGLLGAAASAIIVTVIEELMFRGIIFGGLKRSTHWLAALGVSSVVYSIVHFFKKPVVLPEEIGWASGLQLLPVMWRGLGEAENIIPGFFVLLVTGGILAAAYQRTGGLYCSLGLHAGWVFSLKLYGLLTEAARGPVHPFWGSAKMIDGWLALLALSPLLIWFLARPVLFRRHNLAGSERRTHVVRTVNPKLNM